MFLTATNEDANEDRPTNGYDPSGDGDKTPPQEEELNFPAFRDSSGLVATNNATFQLHMAAGIDTLGVGSENCVFFGSLTRLG
jgi:hypothetical protein